jgi:hypothetical protein
MAQGTSPLRLAGRHEYAASNSPCDEIRMSSRLIYAAFLLCCLGEGGTVLLCQRQLGPPPKLNVA